MTITIITTIIIIITIIVCFIVITTIAMTITIIIITTDKEVQGRGPSSRAAGRHGDCRVETVSPCEKLPRANKLKHNMKY